jgi:hypothetical protein
VSQQTTNRYFDELARGLASGSISRRKALRLMGAALVGGTLASLGIREAAADPPGCKRHGKHCKRNTQCCSGDCDSDSGTCVGGLLGCAPPGAPCRTPQDCCFGVCRGTCIQEGDCGSNGDPCSDDIDCCSNICGNGTCSSGAKRQAASRG